MFKFFKKKDWQASVNSEHPVLVKAGTNLLAAGLESGLNWPHDCRVGSCGTCRCYLRKGKIKELNDFSYVLTPEELDKGMILACQTALKSDVEIDVELAEGSSHIVHLEGVLSSVNTLTHDIMEICITLNSDLPPETLAGQYAEIAYPGLSTARNYSFAKAPKNENPKEATFYVRHVPGGEFTSWLFSDEDRVGTKVTVGGPYGNFWLRESKKNIICIAGGSGMSAVKAILEQSCIDRIDRDGLYLFGARTQNDLYCLNDMEVIQKNWNANHSFEFVPVLSSEADDSGWHGETGYVGDCLKKNYLDTGVLDINKCQAYMCGPPPMIDATIEALVAIGMNENEIFYDKFLDASSIPGGR